MGWMARRFWIFAISHSARDGLCGQIVSWGPKGREVFHHVVWKLWIRTSLVPAKWCGP